MSFMAVGNWISQTSGHKRQSYPLLYSTFQRAQWEIKLWFQVNTSNIMAFVQQTKYFWAVTYLIHTKLWTYKNNESTYVLNLGLGNIWFCMIKVKLIQFTAEITRYQKSLSLAQVKAFMHPYCVPSETPPFWSGVRKPVHVQMQGIEPMTQWGETRALDFVRYLYYSKFCCWNIKKNNFSITYDF